MKTTYSVRQYRPAFVSGYINEVHHNVAFEDILSLPFIKNFKHDDFSHFTLEPDGNEELIIEAYYRSGDHWVVGWAVPSDASFAQNFRYQSVEAQAK